jgi:hypothetical protein
MGGRIVPLPPAPTSRPPPRPPLPATSPAPAPARLFICKVTAPVFATALPQRSVAVVFMLMLVSARMFPRNVVYVTSAVTKARQAAHRGLHGTTQSPEMPQAAQSATGALAPLKEPTARPVVGEPDSTEESAHGYEPPAISHAMRCVGVGHWRTSTAFPPVFQPARNADS